MELTKKGLYLRQDQVDTMLELLHQHRRASGRRFSESLLCRVALDVFLDLKLDLTILAECESEGELLALARQKIQLAAKKMGP